jgi:hypothetical protein
VPQPKLMVRMATVCGNPHVAKAVQHVLEQGGKTGAVQPITTEPSVGSEGGIGVVVHLSKLGRNKSIFHPSNRDNKPKLQINHDDNKMLTQMLFRLTTISENSLTENGGESVNIHSTKVIENFENFPESINTLPSDQRFRSYDH